MAIAIFFASDGYGGVNKLYACVRLKLIQCMPLTGLEKRKSTVVTIVQRKTKSKPKVVPQLKKPRRRKEASATAFLEFGEAMDISQAADLRVRLLAMLEKCAPVVLDASAVRYVDTAAMQILAAFMREARADKIKVTWQQPSDSMCGSARLLGLSELLNLPLHAGIDSEVTMGMEA